MILQPISSLFCDAKDLGMIFFKKYKLTQIVTSYSSFKESFKTARELLLKMIRKIMSLVILYYTSMAESYVSKRAAPFVAKIIGGKLGFVAGQFSGFFIMLSINGASTLPGLALYTGTSLFKRGIIQLIWDRSLYSIATSSSMILVGYFCIQQSERLPKIGLIDSLVNKNAIRFLLHLGNKPKA